MVEIRKDIPRVGLFLPENPMRRFPIEKNRRVAGTHIDGFCAWIAERFRHEVVSAVQWIEIAKLLAKYAEYDGTGQHVLQWAMIERPPKKLPPRLQDIVNRLLNEPRFPGNDALIWIHRGNRLEKTFADPYECYTGYPLGDPRKFLKQVSRAMGRHKILVLTDTWNTKRQFFETIEETLDREMVVLQSTPPDAPIAQREDIVKRLLVRLKSKRTAYFILDFHKTGDAAVCEFILSRIIKGMRETDLPLGKLIVVDEPGAEKTKKVIEAYSDGDRMSFFERNEHLPERLREFLFGE